MPDAIALDESSPEKAGVGGSSPSLATTFSIVYRYPRYSVCSILFQFQNQACRNLPQPRMDQTVPARLTQGRRSGGYYRLAPPMLRLRIPQ